MSEKTTAAAETASTDIVVSDSQMDPQALLAAMRGNDSGIVSTIKADDFKGILTTVAAVQSATPIEEILGKTIMLTNWIGQVTEFKSKDEKNPDGTAKHITGVRTILVDADGKAYQAMSSVIPGDLGLLAGALGEPSTWESPVPVKVVEKGIKPRKFYTIEVDLSAL